MSDGNPLGGLAHLDSVGPLILPSKYCMLQRPRGRKKLLAELRATAAQLKRTVAAAILLAGGRGTGHGALGRARVTSHPPSMPFIRDIRCCYMLPVPAPHRLSE